MKLEFMRGREEEEEPGSAALDGSGILVVNCRGCDQQPDAGSPACVRCIASAISDCGSTDRIQLKSGKDTEISGPAAEILCDLAQLRKVSIPVLGNRRCASCTRSPDRIMDEAWADFPEPSFASTGDRLYTVSGDMPECASCLQRTHSALRMADDSMQKVKEKAAAMASGRRCD